jgi:hypothetical protein
MLVGALNLFSRLLLEHLQLAGVGIPVQGLMGVTLCAVKPTDQGATGGLAKLFDGRQVPAHARVQEQRRSLDVEDGADHLLYSCPTPTSEVLKERQSANSFITRYARLHWRGGQSQAAPQRGRRSVPSEVKKMDLQPGVGSPVMVYQLQGRRLDNKGYSPIRPKSGPNSRTHDTEGPRRSKSMVTAAMETTVMANPAEFCMASADPTA